MGILFLFIKSKYEMENPNILFLQCEKILKKLEDSNGDEEEIKGLYKNLIQLNIFVESNLFSINEELNDIPTRELRFSLIYYFLAETVLKFNNRENRIYNLKTSQKFFTKFLLLMERLEIMNESDLKRLDDMKNNKPITAQEERDFKINRFKKEKEMKQKLEYLNEKKNKKLKQLGEEKFIQQEEDDLDGDEEMEREIILTRLKLNIQQTFEQLGM